MLLLLSVKVKYICTIFPRIHFYVYYTGRWKRKLLIWLCLLVHLCEFITICMAAFNGNLGLILFAICMHTRTNTHTRKCVLLLPFLQFFDCYVWQRQMLKCQTVKKRIEIRAQRKGKHSRWWKGRGKWGVANETAHILAFTSKISVTFRSLQYA